MQQMPKMQEKNNINPSVQREAVGSVVVSWRVPEHSAELWVQAGWSHQSQGSMVSNGPVFIAQWGPKNDGNPRPTKKFQLDDKAVNQPIKPLITEEYDRIT